jgi:hypothetical protein
MVTFATGNIFKGKEIDAFPPEMTGKDKSEQRL